MSNILNSLLTICKQYSVHSTHSKHSCIKCVEYLESKWQLSNELRTFQLRTFYKLVCKSVSNVPNVSRLQPTTFDTFVNTNVLRSQLLETFNTFIIYIWHDLRLWLHLGELSVQKWASNIAYKSKSNWLKKSCWFDFWGRCKEEMVPLPKFANVCVIYGYKVQSKRKATLVHPPAIFVHWLQSCIADSQLYETCLIRIE